MGKYLFGACNLAFEDLKKAHSIIIGKDSQIFELELQLATIEFATEAKEREWKKKLDAEKVREDNAEKEAGELWSEPAQIKEQLPEQSKVKAAAVTKFKASEVYDHAIADAGAPEFLRCWVVSKKHIKTDPAAD